MIRHKSLGSAFELSPINPEGKSSGAYFSYSVDDLSQTRLLGEGIFRYEGAVAVVASPTGPHNVGDQPDPFKKVVDIPTPTIAAKLTWAENSLRESLNQVESNPAMELFTAFALSQELAKGQKSERLLGGLAVGNHGIIQSQSIFAEGFLITSMLNEARNLRRDHSFGGKDSDRFYNQFAGHYDQIKKDDTEPLRPLVMKLIKELGEGGRKQERWKMEESLRLFIAQTVLSADMRQPDSKTSAAQKSVSTSRHLNLVAPLEMAA
jgi:hypothetical protein